MIHPSHYFGSVEGFIHTHPEKIQIAVLNRLAENAGCPTDQIDSVINGAIADIIQVALAPINNTVSTYDCEGNRLPDNRKPISKEELIEAIVNKFNGFSEGRAAKLIDYLILKGALVYDTSTGLLYSQTKLVARQLIELK